MLDIDYIQNANRKRRRIIFASAIIALAVLVSLAGGIYKSTAVAVGAKPAVEVYANDASSAPEVDMVLSRNDILGVTEYKPPTNIYVYNDITDLTHVQYSGGDEITAMPHHPFYVFNCGYIEASKLRAGDMLLLSNGKTVVVEKTQHEILENPITIYNLEVADNHNYFVAGNVNATQSAFALVHNSCYRNNLAKSTGYDPGAKFDAHHQIPQKFKGTLKSNGVTIDVNNAKYLEWMEYEPHRAGAKAYNEMWESALNNAKNTTE